MAYKLIDATQSRWRAVNAPLLVALVRAGAKFENGKLVTRRRHDQRGRRLKGLDPIGIGKLLVARRSRRHAVVGAIVT